jgi:hypothetical protein
MRVWKWFWRYNEIIEAVFWIVQLAPAFYFGYIYSNIYISLLSVYALVKGCIAANHGKQARKEINDNGSA